MITDEEIENLPEEPELAFVAFERILRERSQTAIANASRNDENLDEYRLEYMNKVLGAAKALQVDALKNWEVPSANDNHIFSIYQDFLGSKTKCNTCDKQVLLWKNNMFTFPALRGMRYSAF
jgi:hypothetical protein